MMTTQPVALLNSRIEPGITSVSVFNHTLDARRPAKCVIAESPRFPFTRLRKSGSRSHALLFSLKFEGAIPYAPAQTEQHVSDSRFSQSKCGETSFGHEARRERTKPFTNFKRTFICDCISRWPNAVICARPTPERGRITSVLKPAADFYRASPPRFLEAVNFSSEEMVFEFVLNQAKRRAFPRENFGPEK